MDFQCWFGSCVATHSEVLFSVFLISVPCPSFLSSSFAREQHLSQDVWVPLVLFLWVNKNNHPICGSNIGPPIFKRKIFSCLQMYTSSYCCFPHTRCCCRFNGVHKIFQEHRHCRWPHHALNEFRTGITNIKITYQQPLSPSVGGGWSRRHSPEPWLVIGNVQTLRIPW